MSRKTVAWTTAGALAVVGCIVVIGGLLTPVTFGWFAYQPSANTAWTPDGSGIFVSRVTLFGFLLLTFGLLALAFLGGWQARANHRS